MFRPSLQIGRFLAPFLIAGLTLSGPALALRPQPDRAGLEEELRSSAGLEEQEEFSPYRPATLAFKRGGGRTELELQYQSGLEEALLPLLGELYDEIPIRNDSGDRISWDDVKWTLSFMTEGLLSITQETYLFLIGEGSLPDDPVLFGYLQTRVDPTPDQLLALATHFYALMDSYAGLKPGKGLHRRNIASIRAKGPRRLLPVDWLKEFAERRETTVARAWMHVQRHWSNPETTWPVGRGPQSGLEEPEELEEPALLSRSGGRMYVGGDRWVIPYNEHDEFTRVLLQALRMEGILQPHHEVLDLGTGEAVVAVAIADRVLRVDGTELDSEAVTWARQNVEINGLKNVQIIEGDFFAPPVSSRRYDLILANPPSIPLSPETAGLTRAERLALDGGPDGRRALDRILREAPVLLKEGGALILVHPHFVDLEKTRRMAGERGLKIEMLLERDFPVAVPAGYTSLLEKWREEIEGAHGIPFIRRDGQDHFRLHVLQITRPAPAGPEEAQAARARVQADMEALTKDRPLRWQVVGPSVAGRFPAIGLLDAPTFSGIRVDPGEPGTALLVDGLRDAGVVAVTYYGAEEEYRSFEGLVSLARIPSRSVLPGEVSFVAFLQQLLTNLTALTDEELAGLVNVERLAADLELLEKA